MYAVIKSGGKQYKVEKDDKIKLEKMHIDEGETVDLADVLMVVDGEKMTLGNPFVEGATVSAQVTSHGRHKKVNIVKFNRRKHHRKQMGHRQAYTELSISDISVK